MSNPESSFDPTSTGAFRDRLAALSLWAAAGASRARETTYRMASDKYWARFVLCHLYSWLRKFSRPAGLVHSRTDSRRGLCHGPIRTAVK